MDNLKVGTDLIIIGSLPGNDPCLSPIKPNGYNFSDVDTIMGHAMFHAIRKVDT